MRSNIYLYINLYKSNDTVQILFKLSKIKESMTIIGFYFVLNLILKPNSRLLFLLYYLLYSVYLRYRELRLHASRNCFMDNLSVRCKL